MRLARIMSVRCPRTVTQPRLTCVRGRIQWRLALGKKTASYQSGDVTMRITPGRTRASIVVIASLAAAAAMSFSGTPAGAQPINPQVYKKQFEEARKDAEVVADVRVV